MIYLSLGANLGNRLHNIDRAISLLKKDCFSHLVGSIILEVDAILPANAPPAWNRPYLNMVVCGTSSLSPSELLNRIKAIEREIGRPPSYEKWAPRLIDIDILLWGDATIHEPHLTIPHPELAHRPFLIHLLALLSPQHPFPTQREHPFSNRSFGAISDAMPPLPFIKSLSFCPKLVGIVNITPDSFSDGGLYFETNAAASHALDLAAQGASIIELGAQSTRPHAHVISAEIEYARLAPVFSALSRDIKAGNIRISLDSYWPEVILKLLESYPIAWINDVKGHLSHTTLKTIARHGCAFVAMHALSVPVQKGESIDPSLDPVDTINTWVRATLNRLRQAGFMEEKIIIDPGIGFGKSPHQNNHLIRCAQRIKEHGCPVLFGHSRKSFMASFSTSKPAERDMETIAISNLLHAQGVGFLRVHDVEKHQRFFVAQQALCGGVHIS